jgi:hypothetical protein
LVISGVVMANSLRAGSVVQELLIAWAIMAINNSVLTGLVAKSSNTRVEIALSLFVAGVAGQPSRTFRH